MLVAILLIIILVLLFIIIKNSYAMREINKQIEFKKKTNSNFIITANVLDKNFKKLLKNINDNYNQIKVSQVNSYKKESEMRDMISHLSHDLRTPLTSMKGYITLLANEEDREKRKAYLRTLDARLNNLNNLLDELFTYAKVSDKNYDVPTKKMNLENALAKILGTYYDDFKNQHIEVVIDFKNHNFSPKFNEDLFDRMINNLISNVLKYGKDYLKIRQVNNQLIFMNRCPEKVDTDKIFNRFYKGDNSRTNAHSSGLGLCIVNAIMEYFGGHTSAKWQDGELQIYLCFAKEQ